MTPNMDESEIVIAHGPVRVERGKRRLLLVCTDTSEATVVRLGRVVSETCVELEVSPAPGMIFLGRPEVPSS